VKTLLAVFLFVSVAFGQDAPVYLRPECSVEERVDDLLCRLTLDEKIGFFETENPPVPRLGIPTLSWWNECVHGVGRAGRATMFPVAIGLAATWDVDLMKRVATAISDEARAKHNEAPTNRYHGLTFWAPCVDLARDPRWGRIEETYGEDPHLVTRMGVTFVKALQGDDPDYIKIVATPKHFAAHAQETARHSTSFPVAERTLREYYLEPFRACFVEGGARSCMTAYTGINGIPCMINQWLLTDLLRGEWGFKGAVVTDWGSPNTIMSNYKIVPSHAETMTLGLVAGIDVFSQATGVRTALVAAVQSGAVPESVLDLSLRRSLALRFELGELDPLERVLHAQIPAAIVGCSNHVALALEASRKAIVLLKNEPVAGRNSPTPILPLDRQKIESIAVIGSHANRVFLGAYSGDPAMPAVTTYQGITNHVNDRVIVRNYPVIDLDERRKKLKKNETLDPKLIDEQKRNFEAALDAAARSDVAVVVLGLSNLIEAEGRDRTDMDLPKTQQEFVEQVFAVNPATVVVLINGSPLTINWLQQHVPAIIEAWYPGEQGGNAIADVLFGDYNPAGRLPITFYAGLDQLPNLFDYEISHGRTYMYLQTPPLYPFGYGLSYTCFEYRNLRLNREGEAPAEPSARTGSPGGSPSQVTGTNDTLTVTVDVANTGERDGDEVVQLYIRELDAPWPKPLKQLRGFQRLNIPAGTTSPVSFALKIADLARWSESRHAFVVIPGRFEALVGASSDDIRAASYFRVE